MPRKAPRPCARPGCRRYSVDAGYCAEHATVRRAETNAERGSAASRGYGAKWRREREQYLRESPLCVRCLEAEQVVAATVVDHIIPHKGDQKLFWRRSNWQSLCKPCHDRKTAAEDGGFANRVRLARPAP
ncbi:HNH endonuclease [Ralstonia pseudosolanacearum]|uniref:HNH endonuclease n=1 Tax=Ralstonia pseudosolanacearum TaxID=1310165 RepID=UPI003CECC058